MERENKYILNRLEEISSRYKKLSEEISKPEIISDKVKYQKLTKEFSGMKVLVDKYTQYKKIQIQISETQTLFKETDETELKNLASEELENLGKRQEEVFLEIQQLLLAEDSQAKRDVLIEIRAGTGGLEASLFVADLFRMYSKYATKLGLNVEVMNTHLTEAGGFKEIVFSVKGKTPFGKFKYESGIHRVQRVPETESQGRIHTSAVSVVVMLEPKDVEINLDSKDLRIDVFRSSGPGGQSVNTADSAVRITHLPTGIMVTCQDERSQLKNRIKAMRVLKARLLDKKQHEEQKKRSEFRKIQIGSGDRSEKIRTYNFPDGRVTDHRINLTLYKLESILEGDLDWIINSLTEEERKLKLKQL